ncbi:hypothetical protein, partial [Geminicoccus harenae]|uniref:hypothetical protein n=1 Tax=Geminicoccus harenae TaxID=2498453 RepID=UPI001C961FBE
ALEMKKVNEVSTVPVSKEAEFCNLCNVQGHSLEDCPSYPTFQESCKDQASVNAINQGPYQKASNFQPGETYNSNWKNHPNFKWRNDANFGPYQGSSQQFYSPQQQKQQGYYPQGQYQNHPGNALNYQPQAQGFSNHPNANFAPPQNQSNFAPQQNQMIPPVYQPPNKKSFED